MTQFVAPVAGANAPRVKQLLHQGDSWLLPFDTGPNLGGVLTNDGGGFLHAVAENFTFLSWQVYSDEACTQPVQGGHGHLTGHPHQQNPQFTFTTDPKEIDLETQKYGRPFSTLLPLNTRFWMLLKPAQDGAVDAMTSRDYNQPK